MKLNSIKFKPFIQALKIIEVSLICKDVETHKKYAELKHFKRTIASENNSTLR